MTRDLKGRIFLVTGSSSGIGWETVRGLARRQATVVGISRGTGAGAERMQHLREETGNKALYQLDADLSSRAEVRRVADVFEAQFGQLDVLIHNAGGFFPRRRTSSDGLELTLALNHLAPFLLTHLLVPSLLRSQAPRIVIVASKAETFGKIHFDDLMLHSYGMWKAYAQSKLANLLFAYRLAQLLAGTRITANALHPGTVATGIGGRTGRILMGLARPFFLSAEQGAETPLYLATSPEMQGQSGGYYIDQKPAASSARSHDRETQERLWRVSRDLVGLGDSETLLPLPTHSKHERNTL